MTLTSDRPFFAVSKKALLFVAGCTWFCVGVMLLVRADIWLARGFHPSRILFIVTGIVLGGVVHCFGFSRIVKKNLARILSFNTRRCFFSFMPWKSYLIMIFMIALGVTLRHSALPKEYLAVVYITIGLAMTLSSFLYTRALIRELRQGQ